MHEALLSTLKSSVCTRLHTQVELFCVDRLHTNLTCGTHSTPVQRLFPPNCPPCFLLPYPPSPLLSRFARLAPPLPSWWWRVERSETRGKKIGVPVRNKLVLKNEKCSYFFRLNIFSLIRGVAGSPAHCCCASPRHHPCVMAPPFIRITHPQRCASDI